MDLPKSLTLVSYAVNGVGLGHVSRLCGINRWLRRYGAFAGVKTQHYFLTTSEADTLLFAEGFAAFKLPSKSIVERAGIPKLEYLALAKQWIWNAMGLLRPDLLIVDTFPNGSFDELAPALDLCRKKALVLRPVKAEFADRPAFRSLVRLYDRVVVPEHAADTSRQNDAVHVGPIVMTERWEALPRVRARRHLGVPDGAFCLLVSGGGGGDDSVGPLIDAVLSAVGDDPSVHVVVAAGPLFRGTPRRGPRVTFWTEPRLAEALTGVDGALSAGGFNAVHELLHFGVPTAFFAQPKVADDQAARVDGLVEAGVALSVRPGDPADLKATIRSLRDGDTNARLAAAARAHVPRTHARDAAAALLSLVLPPSVVRQAADELDEATLSEAAAMGVGVEELVDAAVALQPGGRVDRASLSLDDARAYLADLRELQMPARVAVRLCEVVARKAGARLSADELADSARTLAAHSASRGQWSALLSIVERAPWDRALAPAHVVAQLAALLDAGAAAGVDLFRVASELGRFADNEGEGPLPALVRKVEARLRGGEQQGAA